MRYMIYFVKVDHDSERCAPTERTVIEALSSEAAIDQFYIDRDNRGCYIEEVVELTW